MRDEDVAALMPAVDEFIIAVRSRNHDLVEACLHHSGAETLAVVLAELIGAARADMLRAEFARDEALRELEGAQYRASEVARLRKKVRELNRLVWQDSRGVEPVNMSIDRAMEIAVAAERKTA